MRPLSQIFVTRSATRSVRQVGLGSSRAALLPASLMVVALLSSATFGQVSSNCSAPATPISDSAIAESTLTVLDDVTIEDLDVSVDVTHTWIGDLTIVVTSPAGTSVTLFDGAGGASDNIVATWDDEGRAHAAPFAAGDAIQPSGAGALSDFDAELTSGDWALSVTDSAAGDDGALNEWCVIASGSLECDIAPPSGLTCELDTPGVVLEWANADAGYESILVYRGDEEIAVLPGDSTMYVDVLFDLEITDYWIQGIEEDCSATSGCFLPCRNRLDDCLKRCPTGAGGDAWIKACKRATRLCRTSGVETDHIPDFMGRFDDSVLTPDGANLDLDEEVVLQVGLYDLEFDFVGGQESVEQVSFSYLAMEEFLEGEAVWNDIGTGVYNPESDAWEATFDTAEADATSAGIVVRAEYVDVGHTPSCYAILRPRAVERVEPFAVVDDLSPVESTLSVSSELIVVGVKVEIGLEHDLVADVIVEVESPDGTTVRLHDRGADASASGLFVEYSSAGSEQGSEPLDCGCEMRASGPGSLSDFRGDSIGGAWTLRVVDEEPGSSGVLQFWSLKWTGEDAPVSTDCASEATLSVSGPALADQLVIPVSLTASAPESVALEVSNPLGTTVGLLAAGDSVGAELDVLFDDFGVPYGSLSLDCDCRTQPSGPGALQDFSGTGVSGEWVLDVTGEATLEEWCVRVYDAPPRFIRGDANGDGVVFPLIDALYLMQFGFTGGPTPACESAADADDSGDVFPLIDALYLLAFSFSDGPPPPYPHADCGVDLTVDSLSCVSAPCL